MDMHFEYLKAKSFLSGLVEDLNKCRVKNTGGSEHRLSCYLQTLEENSDTTRAFGAALNTSESVLLRDMTLLHLVIHIEEDGETEVKKSVFLRMTETRCIYDEKNRGEDPVHEVFALWQDGYQRLLKWHGMPKK